jgi:hypothetical protein
MFSVDDPFGDNVEAMEFLRATPLSPQEREQLAHGNAERLLKLSSDAPSRSGSPHSFVQNLTSELRVFNAQAKSKLARKVLSFFVK